jgi:hypothetical protein
MTFKLSKILRIITFLIAAGTIFPPLVYSPSSRKFDLARLKSSYLEKLIFLSDDAQSKKSQEMIMKMTKERDEKFNHYKTKMIKEEEFRNANYHVKNFEDDPNHILLARMLLGEAEDCSKIEKIGIAYTAITRANNGLKWDGETLRGAILAPYQYSAFNSEFNAKLKNPLIYNPKEFIEDIALSQEILSGKYQDPTGGATHYINPDHPILNGKIPGWTKNLIEVGRLSTGNGRLSYHVFYKER